jgi:hypothetical protein
MHECREHVFSKDREKKTITGDSLYVFSNLLGLETRLFPELKDFPKTLHLPPEMLGSFFEAVEGTKADGLERSQSVNWDERKKAFKPTDLFVGDVNNADNLLQKWRIYFGKKPLFQYHTHPDSKNEDDPTWDRDFSGVDIAAMKAFPRMGYILGLGSNLGGVFVFQTEQSAKLPVFSIARYGFEMFRIYIVLSLLERQKYAEEKGIATPAELTTDDYSQILHRFMKEVRATQGGKYLKNLDYGCYVWSPGDQNNATQGLQLQRFDSI